MVSFMDAQTIQNASLKNQYKLTKEKEQDSFEINIK